MATLAAAAVLVLLGAAAVVIDVLRIHGGLLRRLHEIDPAGDPEAASKEGGASGLSR